MIYIFKFIPGKKDKYTNTEFTLTADTKTQLYTRIQSQYGVPKEKIEILKELEEDSVNLNGGNKDGKKESKLHNRGNKK